MSLPTIVFDTDPGADDALALLWLCALDARGRANIAGLTTVGGNVPPADTFMNADRLLHLCGRDDLPIARGHDHEAPNAQHVHGEDGLAGLRHTLAPSGRRLSAAPVAAQYLIDAGHDAAIDTLVAVGPLTNLGAAVARDEQALARIGRIIVMGGALGPGNITPHAEFNVYHDPEAFQTALHAGRLNIVTLEQTHQVWFSADEVPAGTVGGAIGGFVDAIIEQMFRDSVTRIGERRFYLHDSVAVAAACYPQFVRFRDASLRVLTTGEQRGALRERNDGEHNARVADTVDAAAIKAAMIDDLRFLSDHIS